MDNKKREQVEKEDLGFLRPQLEKSGLSNNEVPSLIKEYKRYLVLRLINFPNELPMYSLPIDRVWHAHILHTKAYRTFCDKLFGGYLDHRPYSTAEFTERLPEYFSVTIPMYKQVFREEAPACWHII